MLLESVQKDGCEPEVTGHELAGIFRPVYPCEVKNEVRLITPAVQFFWSGIKVVFKDFCDGDTVVTGLAITDVLQLCAEVPAYETLGASDKYSHFYNYQLFRLLLLHDILFP